jgi:putative PEP-CTERM system TPR-repeat lipoprotein
MLERHWRWTAAAAAALLLIACSGDSPEKLVASAKEYLAKQDRNAAVIQLRNALQQNGDLAEARFLLGKTLLERGDAPGAEKELRLASALQYSDEQVVPLWARSLVLTGDYKRVIEELSKKEISAPQAKAELLTAVGQSHLALRNPDAARQAFTEALEAQPEYVPAQLGHARVSAQAGNLAQAITEVAAALKIAPSDPDALQLKGDLLLAQNQREPALEAYRKAVEAKPDSVSGHMAVMSILIQQQKLDEAAKQLAALKQTAPNNPQTLYMQALLAYLQKDYAAAREAILQQLRVAPDNLRGLLLAGIIELELKSYSQTEMYELKVLDQAPRQRLARRTLILSYLRSGQPAKALEALKPVVNGIGEDPKMLALAGEVYMVNGEAARAAELFAKAAALDPKDASTRTSLALSRAAAGDPDNAMHELEQAAAADSAIRADLALIARHAQRREYDQAMRAIATLEKKQPGTPLADSLRGGVALAKRDLGSARQYFERALKTDPTYFPAVSSLASIDLAENKLDSARQRYETLTAKDPKHMQALLALAALRARVVAPNGSPKAADAQVVELLDQAISGNPRESAPRVALISYYLNSNDPKNAARVAQDAAAALPERAEILDAAGRAYQANGDTFQALKMYENISKLQRGSAQPYLRMAEIQLAAKNKDEAVNYLRKARDVQPDSIEAQRGLIMMNVDGGRIDEAVAIAREVQKQRPREAAGYLLEGDVYASQRKLPEAATAYRTGLEKTADSALAIRLYAVLSADNAKEAERFAASWLKEHPKDSAFRLQLAETAAAKKDYATAAQQYRRILDTQPNNAIMLNNLAWTEGQLKNPKAVELAENANKLAPNQPAIMDTLGVLLVDTGDSARGLDLLKRASGMAPNVGSIRLNFAKALIKSGQKDAARKELDELTKLGDKFAGQAEVQELKQRL